MEKTWMTRADVAADLAKHGITNCMAHKVYQALNRKWIDYLKENGLVNPYPGIPSERLERYKEAVGIKDDGNKEG